MKEMANALIDKVTQCWACPLFDKLFEIISNTAAALYERLSMFGVMLFCALFAFYLANAFWQNIKSGAKENLFTKTLQPLLIKALIVLSILSVGITVPKFISKITFEPVATVTLEYTKAMLPEEQQVSDKYQAIQLNENGFFNSELRDTILKLLQTSVIHFQSFIKVGVAVMDHAFSFSALFSISNLLKRLIVFFVGLFLTYYFAKLFIQYSFYFMDIIVAMAMFAFFFPLSLIFFIFKGADNLPDWMKNLGKGLGGTQVKTLINAIVSVAAAILDYTIIIIIVRGFITGSGMSIETFESGAKSILDFNLDNPNAIQITFFGAITLIFVIQYLAKQIPNITKEIMSAFELKREDSKSNAMGKGALQLTTTVVTQTTQIIKKYREMKAKKDDNKTETKKTDK